MKILTKEVNGILLGDTEYNYIKVVFSEWEKKGDTKELFTFIIMDSGKYYKGEILKEIIVEKQTIDEYSGKTSSGGVSVYYSHENSKNLLLKEVKKLCIKDKNTGKRSIVYR